MINSPNVATYDLQPAMNAPLLTEKLVAAIKSGQYDTIICNYANPDMVGHSGNFNATVKAIEALDKCLVEVIDAANTVGGELLITADHGNAEQMVNPNTGQAHTAHTTNPVPLIYVGERPLQFQPNHGALSDIAPTMLYLMDLPQPPEMTGRCLFDTEAELSQQPERLKPMSRPARPLHPESRQGLANLLLPILIGLALFITLVPHKPVFAEDEEYSDTSDELKNLRRRIDQLRQEVARTRDQHDKARGELREVELRISKHIRELKYIHFRLGQQDRRLGQLYHDRKRYQKDLQLQRKLLGRQIHTAYIMGQQAYLKLLLSQDDPAAAGRTLKYYDYFHRSRSDRIKQANMALARFEQNKRDINREKKRLADLREYSLKKKTQLEADSRQRGTMVARLNRQLQGKTTSLNRMLEDERQLQRLLEGIEKLMPEVLNMNKTRQPFRALKGKLTWPAAGKVQRLYGRKRGRSKASWNGVIIKAGEGKEVHAVSHGRVAYADWLRGYGLLLIIDHGNGYMSLYGHNQSLYKETGDWVETGEAIATIGNSGGHTHSGLYFEIRHKGKPSNPIHWCRKSRRS